MIVTDDLVPNVLLLTSLVVAGVTGVFAQTVANVETLSFSSLNEPEVGSFMYVTCTSGCSNQNVSRRSNLSFPLFSPITFVIMCLLSTGSESRSGW
jgi:hypothetical protein